MVESWPIIVPRESVNDDFVILVKWLAPDGSRVAASAPIAQIETSKTVVDLASDHDGYLVHGAKELEEVAVGSQIGMISSGPQAVPQDGPSEPALPPDAPVQQRFSKKAKDLINEHHLDVTLFAGRAFVREQDVLAVLKAQPQDGSPSPARRGRAPVAQSVPLSPLKRSEIRYLTEGNKDALLSAVTVIVSTEVLDAAIEAAAASRRLEYLDFIIPVAARTLRQHRELNAFLSDQRLNYYAEINIGVALNMDEGLLVPVIRQADLKSPEDVSRQVADFAMKSIRGELVEDDLVRATFTVTDLSVAGAFHVFPLINREQSAILAVGRAASAARPCLVLALAFDHRVADGLIATRFLQEIKALLENYDHYSAEKQPVVTAPLVCSGCLNTLDRLRDEGVTDFLIPIVKGGGAAGYMCPVCFLGWNA